MYVQFTSCVYWLKPVRVSVLRDMSHLIPLLKFSNVLLLECKGKLKFSALSDVSPSNSVKYSFSNLLNVNQINLFSKSVLALCFTGMLTGFTPCSGRYMEAFCTLSSGRISITLSALRVVQGNLGIKREETICILS